MELFSCSCLALETHLKMENEGPLGPRGQSLCLTYLCWLVPLMMHFVYVRLCYLDVCDGCDLMFKGFAVFCGIFL